MMASSPLSILLVACIAFAGISAQSNSDHTGINPSLDLLQANDLVTLNFALTFERLGYNFYSYFLGRFDSTQFGAYGGAPTYAYLQMIRDHEDSHQNIVASAIIAHGGTPVGNCTYNFASITTVDQFMQAATMIENTCTMALDGAAGALFDKGLLQTAASLATVEGRHSSFLQYVTTAGNPSLNPAGNQRAYPFANYTMFGNGAAAFEIALTPQQVLDAVALTGLLTCAYNLTQPSVFAIDFSFASVSSDTNPTIDALNSNDIAALNYALTLEHLEATYYTTYQDIFTADDFASIGLDRNYDYLTFNLIRDHENSHVDYLTKVINALGGSPVAACTYNFSISTQFDASYTRQDGLRAYINAARAFENLGVTAYDGALNRITNKVLIQAATTVATIEARHAAYLNYLPITATNANAANGPFYTNAGNPFPSAQDSPANPDDVLSQASKYIISCPTAPAGPALLNIFATQLPPTTTSSSASGSAGQTTTSTTGQQSNDAVSSKAVMLAFVLFAVLAIVM